MKAKIHFRGRAAGLMACVSLVMLAFGFSLQAQPYSVNWYKVSGGGGTSTGSGYSVSGTIGQHDAGGPMRGSGYSVTGGFWALSAVQIPGITLNISWVSPHSVKVWWVPGSVDYLLQTNASLLAKGNWFAYGGPITNSGGTNSVTITPPNGNLFFRLSAP